MIYDVLWRYGRTLKMDNTVINGNSAFRCYYKICRSKKCNLEKVTKRIKFLQTSAVHCYETEWLSEPVLILEVIFYHIQVNFYYNDAWSCYNEIYSCIGIKLLRFTLHLAFHFDLYITFLSNRFKCDFSLTTFPKQIQFTIWPDLTC